MYQKQKSAKEYLLNNGFKNVKIGIILNPVFKDILNDIEIIEKIPYNKIPGFPVDTNNKSEGNLIYGKWDNTPVIIMDRALQYYKGYKANEIIFPIRIMMLFGIDLVISANFCGSVNPAMEAGSFMINEDYINMISDNPFIGQADDFPGPRFLDLNEAYPLELIYKIKKIAHRNDIQLYQGIYLSLPGPSFPSPAEYRFYKTIGADVIGNSGVFECMAVRQVGGTFISLSIITENCDPNKPDPKSSSRMLETVQRKEGDFKLIIDKLIAEF